MKFLLLSLFFSLANFALAEEKMHGEFSSPNYKKCQSMENCPTCLAANHCQNFISQNMVKTITPRKSGSGAANGKASGLGQ